MTKSLSVERIIDIRFSEVDSMGVVWHGCYVKYLEDGRESFGAKYGLTYSDVALKGYLIPIIELNLSYKKFAKYGERLIINTKFINSQAAKIIFEYTILRESDREVLLKAKTVQVFTDSQAQLLLNKPDFYEDWQKENCLV